MKTLKKFIAAVASAGLISLNATPAFAAVNIVISDNGSGSDQDVNVTDTQTTTVTQTNDADVDNTVTIDAETGDNSASGNTGGDTTIDTGNSTVTSLVDNAINSNVVETGCDCIETIDVEISGNGSDSDNTFDLDSTNTYTVTQFNTAVVDNTVTINSDTGDNAADDNTNGEVTINTGNADVDSDLLNAINSNFASIGASDLDGMITVDIIGNGSRSDNDVLLTFTNTVTPTQVNDADVLNTVTIDAETGDNSASDNTGGDISVDTGNVDVGSLIDNGINFNFVEADCCEADLTGAISTNGSDSDNTIDYDDISTLTASQFNDCGTDDAGPDCDSTADLNGDSGDNTGDDNTTGEVEIITGNATVDGEITNSVNVNDLLTL